MEGTEEFLNLAIEEKNCQNEESVLECRSKKYLDIGKDRCQCTPHHLRNFSKLVNIFKELEHACHSLYTVMALLFLVSCIDVLDSIFGNLYLRTKTVT